MTFLFEFSTHVNIRREISYLQAVPFIVLFITQATLILSPLEIDFVKNTLELPLLSDLEGKKGLLRICSGFHCK